MTVKDVTYEEAQQILDSWNLSVEVVTKPKLDMEETSKILGDLFKKANVSGYDSFNKELGASTMQVMSDALSGVPASGYVLCGAGRRYR